VLDVGGATLEDTTYWSTWQDPEASRRSFEVTEEETQGNGGKAYMYRLFSGATRILGVKNGRRNCKGFEGPVESVERGTPGWIPTAAEGRDVETSSWQAELREALAPYGVTFEELPEPLRNALTAREAFTLVEGTDPIGLYKGRIDAEDLIDRVVRSEQATLALDQVGFFAIHNGRLANRGKKLTLPPIRPWPELDRPLIYEIPEQLRLENGQLISTTEGGSRDRGRLMLHTSAENMPAAYKNLKPRRVIAYRTQYQMIGAKAVTELFPSNPPAGAQYVYGTVELSALEPAYVELGRRKPKPGPLMEALDLFVAEKIREVAQQINSKRQAKLDETALDQVHAENRRLDEFKNRYLPSYGEGSGGPGNSGDGPQPSPSRNRVWGTVPDNLEYAAPGEGLNIGKGITVALRPLLNLSVRDSTGRPVQADLEWLSDDPYVAEVSDDGELKAKEMGSCHVHVRVKGTTIESDPISVRVWNVDHVLLTPRNLEIPLGTRQEITAEVTDDTGVRSTDVLLDWKHDAEDQLIVRVSHRGLITANRLGRTAVTAGAGEVWARLPADVQVIPNPEKPKSGKGFPKLLVTGRDIDPATGTVREGDPDAPALWQEPSDFIHNIWWLNLQNPQAAFAFRSRGSHPVHWRAYHAGKIIEMVVLVWMAEEFTRKGDQQRPQDWAQHLLAMDRHVVRVTQQMWDGLENYVAGGAIETEDRSTDETEQQSPTSERQDGLTTASDAGSP
jgi:hypothetical protein